MAEAVRMVPLALRLRQRQTYRQSGADGERVGEGSNRGTRDVGLRLVGRGPYLECGEGGCRADQNNSVERRSHDFITSALLYCSMV
jgi:hypothetical protein